MEFGVRVQVQGRQGLGLDGVVTSFLGPFRLLLQVQIIPKCLLVLLDKNFYLRWWCASLYVSLVAARTALGPTARPTTRAKGTATGSGAPSDVSPPPPTASVLGNRRLRVPV